MLIALDYDDTFTEDPIAWRAMVHLFKERGHEFVMVTAREDEGRMGDEVREDIGDLMPVVFSEAEWKRQAAIKAGYRVDVWIDDTPTTIDKQFLIGH